MAPLRYTRYLGTDNAPPNKLMAPDWQKMISQPSIFSPKSPAIFLKTRRTSVWQDSQLFNRVPATMKLMIIPIVGGA
jgi:hypothetical protein